MSLADGATKKSLFIQVRSYPSGDLTDHLDHVREEHKDRSKDDYIFNVVLDEIGDAWGNLSPSLHLILPYLPGGAKRTFDNVFVGSHFIRWDGKGSAYNTGMKDPAHRWASLGIQRALWSRFADLYSGPWHFYINHEGVLDWLDDDWLRACYEAYLIQSRRDADGIRPSRALLWSPSIWSGKPLSAKELSNVKTMFGNVARVQPPGVNWLHLQDMMGRGRADITNADVLAWYTALKEVGFASLRVNMESFTKDEGRNVPEDPAVLAAREDWYERHGLPVGASWEMRYWIENHREL